MIRPKEHLRGIERTPAEPESRMEALRLDKNEFLPCWPAEWFQEFLAALRPEHLSIHTETWSLYRKLEERFGIPRECMVLTAGSDGAIRTAFELFVEPGDEVVIPNPTFAMYYVYARVFGARLIQVDYGRDLTLPAKRMLDAINSRTKLVAIANPNSPTGTVFTRQELLSIVEHASGVGAAVLVDEAYYPFYEESLIGETARCDNLIVTRTFSKAAGLAGMRVGVFASSPEIARLAFGVKPMYEVTTVSALLAEQVLDHYHRVGEYAEEVRRGRAYLARHLERHGFRVALGHANFLHVDFGAHREAVTRFLQQHGVLFKERFGHPSLQDYCRFTVGPTEYMRRLAELIDAHLER